MPDEVNLDEIREFFDPHPGVAGADERIPGPVQRVAFQLAGKSVTLRAAKQLFEEALATWALGEVTVRPEMVTVNVPPLGEGLRTGCSVSMWRAIRHRLPPSGARVSSDDTPLVAVEFDDRETLSEFLHEYLSRRPTQYFAVPGRNTLVVPRDELGWLESILSEREAPYRKLKVRPLGDASAERIAQVRRHGRPLSPELLTSEGRKALLDQLRAELAALRSA